jgi:hypothetical protein
MKLSKQARKRILAELNEIRDVLNKQASSGFFKPYPIEYEDEADLNASIDSVLLDILDGFGYMGATKVVVKGDTAYVKGEFELELDVKKIIMWWDSIETNWDKVAKDIAKLLGRKWVVQYFEHAYRIWNEEGADRNQWGKPFDSQQVSLNENPNTDWLVYNDGAKGGDIVTKSELSGDYRKDIAYIAKAINNFF